MNTAAAYLRNLSNRPDRPGRSNVRRMSWLVAAGIAIVLGFAPDRSEAQYTFGKMCRDAVERDYQSCLEEEGNGYWARIRCRLIRFQYLSYCPIAV